MEKKELNIVDVHRNMLMVSKNLSEFQIQNMKQWPFIFLSDIKEAKISYDFIKDDLFYPGVVTYEIETNSELIGESLHLGISYLEASVKLMFWSDTEVKITIDGALWKEPKLLNIKKTTAKTKTKASKNTSKVVVQV